VNDLISPVLATIVGQPTVQALLTGAAEAPVHAFLFIGPAGSGKRSAAMSFGAALLCPNGGCGACRDCRLALLGEHPDVRIVERVGPFITTEQADDIIKMASRAPVEGSRKVLILDEFHLLRPEAAAKLLKTVEEPAASTVFIVIADDVTPELVTIASRCMRVEFRPLSNETVLTALLAEGVSPALAEPAALAAGGDLDRARLLAADPGLSARRAAFANVPRHLDGTGTIVISQVALLLSLIEEAAAPLAARHLSEIAEMDERIKAMGERGSGKKQLEERHKRELRRHRTDEIRAGLVAIASTYRDALVAGAGRHATAYQAAVVTVHASLEAMERNPNDTLQLQSLLLRLPPISS
jgi:DNA polymerase III subunit delta'